MAKVGGFEMQRSASTRLVLLEQGNILEIQFSAWRWGWWLFLTLLVAIATISGAFIFGALSSVEIAGGNSLPWLWAICETVLIFNWLWLFFGKETVIVKPNVFILQRDLFGYGGTIRFNLDEVAKLRLAGFFEGFGAWALTNQFRRSLVFYADGRKYLFGMMLKTKEAQLAVNKIQTHLRKIA